MFVFVTALFFLTHDPFIHLSLPPVFPSTVIVLTALTCVVNSSPVYINLSTRLSRLPEWTIIVICRYQYFLPVVPDCEWAQCLCTLVWTKSIIVVIGSMKVFTCAGSCHTHTRSECKHWLGMGKNKTNNPSSWINVSVVQVTLQESHVYRRNIHSSIKLLLSAAYICFYF